MTMGIKNFHNVPLYQYKRLEAHVHKANGPSHEFVRLRSAGTLTLTTM